MFNTKRLVLSLLVILGVQFALNIIFSALGVGGILYIVLYALALSFFFALMNFPRLSGAKFLKEPYFYRYWAIMFIILFAIDFIYYYVF